MSKYDEMREAAAVRRKDWIACRDRNLRYLIALVNGFVEYCGIPSNQYTFLRWHRAEGETPVYKEAQDNMEYSLPAAVVFDEEDGYWHLGMRVRLTPPGVFPTDWFFFAFCVTEEEGGPMVKVASFKPTRVDFSDANWRSVLYDPLVEDVKRGPSDTKKGGLEGIGFTANRLDEGGRSRDVS